MPSLVPHGREPDQPPRRGRTATVPTVASQRRDDAATERAPRRRNPHPLRRYASPPTRADRFRPHRTRSAHLSFDTRRGESPFAGSRAPRSSATPARAGAPSTGPRRVREGDWANAHRSGASTRARVLEERGSPVVRSVLSVRSCMIRGAFADGVGAARARGAGSAAREGDRRPGQRAEGRVLPTACLDIVRWRGRAPTLLGSSLDRFGS